MVENNKKSSLLILGNGFDRSCKLDSLYSTLFEEIKKVNSGIKNKSIPNLVTYFRMNKILNPIKSNDLEHLIEIYSKSKLGFFSALYEFASWGGGLFKDRGNFLIGLDPIIPEFVNGSSENGFL